MATAAPHRNVSVYVRVRPQAKDEENSSEPQIRQTCEDYATAVFSSRATQDEVYRECGESLVAGLFEGFNGCLFAYGQTGCGKTYSMLGPCGGRDSQQLHGVVPQVTNELFRQMEQQQVDAASLLGGENMSEFQLRASYVEVFMERVYDLLAPPQPERKALHTRSTGDGAFIAVGATQLRVSSTQALLELVADASTRRVTDETGLNSCSSRSHAVLSLHLEYRWQTHATTSTSRKTAAKSKSRTSTLVLVDLAGSENASRAHGGLADASGCAINRGLLALGQVCHALANGHAHVPFRTSVLTRLLQSSLRGNCRTSMLACVSDEKSLLSESLRTLRFAERVAGLRTLHSVKASVRDVQDDDNDPMRDDIRDTLVALDRRAMFLRTSTFGEVFARVCGRPDSPLILWVHGSGPRNSSLFWNRIILNVHAVQEHFFHVAIDCPGYGRSVGDRQSIRSYPGKLLQEVVQSLGKQRAFCLVGCSQGACAVFNATLEHPNLTHHLAVCHPVGHDVARYSTISQHSLLIFDHDDDGHPISVGIQMRKFLQRPHWVEFCSRERPSYVEDFMAKHLTDMFRATQGDGPGTTTRASRDAVLNSSTRASSRRLQRCAGGVRAWSRSHGREYADWQTPEHLEATQLGNKTNEQGCASPGSGPITPQAQSRAAAQAWVASVDSATNRVVYTNCKTEARTFVRPSGVQIDLPARGGVEGGQARSSSLAPLFETKQSAEESDRLERHRQQQLQRAEELSKTRCDRCQNILFVTEHSGPVLMQRCRHAICVCCTQVCLRWHRHCPVCGVEHDSVACGKQVDDELNAALLRRGLRLVTHAAHGFAHENTLTAAALQTQSQLLHRIEHSRTQANACVVVLEFGNRAATGQEGAGRRVLQTTFVRVVHGSRTTAKGARSSIGTKQQNIIAKVEFNINPSYLKPTATVKAPNGGGGRNRRSFELERALNFSFPCFMTVHWAGTLGGLAPLKLEYFTQLAHKTFAVRVVVVVPNEVLASLRGRSRRSRKECPTWSAGDGEGWFWYQSANEGVCDVTGRAQAPARRSSSSSSFESRSK